MDAYFNGTKASRGSWLLREIPEDAVRCDNCGRGLNKHTKTRVHINRAQDPSHHFFCSDECKNNWCYAIAKQGGRKV